MARVLLCGYYGFDNLGDSALLFSIVSTLRRQIPGIEIEVMSNKPEHTAQQYNVKAVDRWHLPSVWGAIRRSSALVMGGGSLLQDVTGIKSLLYYLGVIRMAQLCGRPVFFYAQGIGPITTRAGRMLASRVVNRLPVVTVRDQASREELLALGVDRPRITVVSDPVLGMSISPELVSKGHHLLHDAGWDGGKPLVGVSLRFWENWNLLKREVAEVADALAARGCTVAFLPMQAPADTRACREAAELMHHPALLVDQAREVEDIIGVVAACDLVIGMRLHSLIMAAAAGVPMAGISYDPKVDAFLEEIGRKPATTVAAPSCDDILDQVMPMLDHLPEERAALARAIAPLVDKAQVPAAILRDILDS